MKIRKIRKQLLNRRLLVPAVVFLATAAALELTNTTDFINKNSQIAEVKKTPSRSVERNGGIIDRSGDVPIDNNQTNEGNGVTSASGNITVLQPKSNSLLKSGSTISGLSKTTSVSYRLIDNDIGVVATGSIQVVDGKFAGKFDFNSEGSKGRLDIFNTLDDGREVDVVEIPVRFK